MKDIIVNLCREKIADILETTSNLFYYCSPNIHPEMAEKIASMANSIKDIKIIIDPSENSFRNGYGDIKAIDKLRDSSAQIFEIANNMVSFIIADETGYFFFPESRMFTEDAKGNNAVLMDKLMLQQIKNYFFPPINHLEKSERTNEILDSFNELKDEFKKMSDSISFDNHKSPVEKFDEEKVIKSKGQFYEL